MGARVALLLCLIAVSGAAAATLATTAESTVTFLPPPDKVDLLKAVTDPQLEGEGLLQACQPEDDGGSSKTLCSCAVLVTPIVTHSVHNLEVFHIAEQGKAWAPAILPVACRIMFEALTPTLTSQLCTCRHHQAPVPAALDCQHPPCQAP